MGLAMDDPTRDTAAAMLKALRSADLSNQPLAGGLADALDELLAQSLELVHITNEGKYDVVYAVDIRSVIYHLRANNHA